MEDSILPRGAERPIFHFSRKRESSAVAGGARALFPANENPLQWQACCIDLLHDVINHVRTVAAKKNNRGRQVDIEAEFGADGPLRFFPVSVELRSKDHS